MKLWSLFLLFLIFSACRKEGVKPCRSDFQSIAYVSIADFRDSVVLGDRLTVVMDFFPQDDRGKFLVLPPDFKYEWGIVLKRLDRPVSNQPDTLTYEVSANQGEILEIRPDVIRVRCARNGNKQQARISFNLMKAGRYSVEFYDSRSGVEFSQWGECKAYLTFSAVNVVQPKGLFPRPGGYTFYVKS